MEGKNMFIPTLNKKKKLAVSAMIGYILLITFAIVIAGVVYAWLKTYVPKEGIACPDGVSIYVSDYNFDNTKKELNLILKNNGQFSVGGIYIYYSIDENEEIAANPMVGKIKSGAALFGESLRFGTSGAKEEDGTIINFFEPSDEISLTFSASGIDYIYAVEITPIRWQEEKNKIKLVSCANAKTKKILDLNIKTGTIGQIEEAPPLTRV